MRILFANPISALGGAELFLLEMLAELSDRDPSIELHLVSGTDGALLERAAQMGVECQCVPMQPTLLRVGDSAIRGIYGYKIGNVLTSGISAILGGASLISYARRFRRVVDSIRPSIVVSNGLKFHAITGLSGTGNARLVWFMHDYLSSRALMRNVLPKLAGSVSLILANSRSVADDIGRLIPLPQREVVYCGIDRQHFAPGQGDGRWLDQLAESNPLPSNAVRVGMVATFARWKGQDLFIDAAARVLQQTLSSPVGFYIIGGPIYSTHGSQYTLEELRGIVEHYGLEEHIRFVPFQDDTSAIYRSLDVVVHASKHPEPFGRTILEAMSCGRSVIATQAGGAIEIFKCGESALGFPLGDTVALSHAMTSLIGSPHRRVELGKKARESTVAFSRAVMGERLQACLETL